ncbi:MAG: hypothetical protein ACRD2D_05760 [Terriglobales bacterium]
MGLRPGDETDDYCTRCHRLTNHTIAAVVGEGIAQTTCRTCRFTHDYKQGRAPARNKPKSSAFDEVLAGILGSTPPPPAATKPARGKKR